MLLVEQLAQGGFLVGAALQEEQRAIHGLAIGGGSAIELGAGEGMGVALERYKIGFVNRLRDAGTGNIGVGLSEENCRQPKER